MLLQGVKCLFAKDCSTHGILFVRIDSDDLSAPSLTVGVLLHLIAALPDEQPLHLPRRYAVFQLFGKLGWIGGRIKRFDHHERSGLMLTVVVTGRRMIGNDDVRPKFANLEDHAAQSFFVTPEPESLITRFRESEIFQPKKVRFGAF